MKIQKKTGIDSLKLLHEALQKSGSGIPCGNNLFQRHTKFRMAEI